jgi:hypothetical protein
VNRPDALVAALRSRAKRGGAVAKRVWRRLRPREAWSPWISAVSLAVLVVAFYLDRVFVRHQLTITAYDISFSDARLRVEMVAANGGNRDATVLDMRLTRSVAAPGLDSGASVGDRFVDPNSQPFPLILKPGEIRQLRIVQDYDVLKAFTDPVQGHMAEPKVKEIEFSLKVEALDSSGALTHATHAFFTERVGPDGPIRGSGRLFVPIKIFDVWHPLGPLW